MFQNGICVTYRYGDDEGAWDRLVSTFTAALAADAEVRDGFDYTIHCGKDGVSRVHIGRWDTPERVATVQSRPYFKTFSEGLKAMAGDSLVATPFTLRHASKA